MLYCAEMERDFRIKGFFASLEFQLFSSGSVGEWAIWPWQDDETFQRDYNSPNIFMGDTYCGTKQEYPGFPTYNTY